MDQLFATRGVVLDATLVYQQDGRQVTLSVGTSSWLAWVQTATSFTFKNEEGSFTAHKTRASNGRGGWYWYASRRWRGHLFKRYLGTSEHLTLSRLREVAHDLTVCTGDTQREQPASSLSPALSADVFVVGDDPMLLTKLQSPRLPMHHVSRPRLLTLLEQSLLQPVTLVSAPAGSGKTTSLAEWATTTSVPVAWISCDAADNDPARFLSCLIAAASRLDERMSAAVQPHRSWCAHDHERVLTSLLNGLERLLQQDAVILLDDAHLLTAEAVQAALRFLFDHLPTRLHLIIGTRVDPPLPLARLRAHGQLSELRFEELRFVSAEVEAFVHAVGLTLSGAAKDLLQQCTEGWIAGIQLLALALRGKSDAVAFLRTFGGQHCFLLDYVSEEVLSQQTPELQRFLLRTCILERMTGQLCDAVTGESGGQDRLATLLRMNLFVSVLDETQTWYRYHPLFAEALRAQLHKQEPELIAELYRRASRWYEEHQDRETACAYAFLARDLPHAAQLLEGVFPHLVEQGRLEQVATWLGQLPPAVIAASPRLSVAWVGAQGLRKHSLEHMEQLLERLERQIQAQPQDAAPWAELQRELALRQAVAAFSQHEFARTITLAHDALQLIPAQESALSRFISLRLRVLLSRAYRASGDLAAAELLLLEVSLPQPLAPYDPLNVGAAWSLARLYAAQGQLRKQGRLYESVFLGIPSEVALPPLVLALLQGSRAVLLYEWNRLLEASQAAQQSILLAEQMGLAVLSSSGLWIQACIGLAQGQAETARQFLQQRREQPQVQMPLAEQEEVSWAAIHARLALACGQVEEAWQWERSCGRRFDDRPGPELSGANYFEYVTLARVLIARGRRERSEAALSRARLLLDHLRDLVMRVGLRGWFLEIQMLTALALQAQGKIKQALTMLGAVLAQAEPEGYVRLFADEGQPMAQLLAHISGSTTASASYIHHLQDALAHTAPVPADLTGPAAPQPLPSPLSPREQEVLALLVLGLSNQQIAERLVISLNTVKCHVKHLLAKLVVTNRTQALVRARELHLL